MFAVTKRLVVKALEDDILIFGGFAAYAGLLALFPFIIFLMAIAGLIGSPDEVQTVINSGLDYLPPSVMDVIAPVIRSIMTNDSPGLLTVGAVGALWVASSGVEGLRAGLNRVHGAAETRPIWRLRLQSAGVVLGGAGALFLLALLVIVWPLLADAAADYFSIPLEDIAALNPVRLLLALALLVTMIGALYRLLPSEVDHTLPVWPGALLAAVLWLALAQLFSLYLAYFGDYDVTYGSIGGVIVTLIFFHYSATVVLLGAELNEVLPKKDEAAEPAA